MLGTRKFIVLAIAVCFGAIMPAFGEEIGYLHTVLFSLKPGLSAEEREAVLFSVRAQAKVPGVKSFVLAPNLLPPSKFSNFQWVAMADYASRADSNAFQASVAHRTAVAKSFTPYVTDLLFCDMEQPFATRIADSNGNKVRRIVLFNFKPETAEAQRLKIGADLAALKDNPVVKRAIFGKNAYRRIAESPLEWQLILEFAKPDDAKTFAYSPAREAYDRNVFTPAVQDVVVVDIALD